MAFWQRCLISSCCGASTSVQGRTDAGDSGSAAQTVIAVLAKAVSGSAVDAGAERRGDIVAPCPVTLRRMRTTAPLTCVVLIAALGRHLCERAARSGCPHLGGCACMKVRRGLRVLCNATVDGDALSADISKLAGFSLNALILDGVNLTVLPSQYFENLTVTSLSLKNTPLQSTTNGSFQGAKILSTLHMGGNRLCAIPRGLQALPTLKILRLPDNYITSLENIPPLENLTELDLSDNLIARLNGSDLRGLGGLKKVLLANNLIHFMSHFIFKSVKHVMFVDLHNNFLTSIFNAFQGLDDIMHTAHDSGSKIETGPNYSRTGNTRKYGRPNALVGINEIDLSNNRIIGIDKLSTGSTPKLKILRAGDNDISWLSKFGPRNIAIEKLELRNCNISALRTDTFSQLSELKILDLSYNAIEYIPGSYFHKESKLKYFNIAANKLRSINSTFKATRRMEKLNLSMNYIEDIGEAFVSMPALKILTLRNNRIQFIQDDTFKFNSNIEHLDLSGNKLDWVGKDCFLRLFRLRVLLVTGTSLALLNGSLHGLPYLKYLFIHDNRLQRLTAADFEGSRQLSFIYASRNNITSVRGAFRGLHDLQTLRLDGNRLRSVHRASFPDKLDKLKRLELGGNPLLCDCQLTWLVKSAASLAAKGVPVCQGPHWNRGEQLFNLSVENLTAWFTNCSRGCDCACLQDTPFSAAIHVNCSRKGLKELPEEFPSKTRVLDLSWNRLSQLKNELIFKTPFLVSLNLANNLLSDIGTGVIPRSTERIDLSKNSLRTFPFGMVSERTVVAIRLSGNPWECSCQDYSFRQWAEAHSSAIQDYNETVCAQGQSQYTSGKKFMHLGEKDLCPSLKVFIVLAYGIPFLALLVTVMASVTVYLKYKQQIRVWLYARGICHTLQCIKEDDIDEDKDFDVFLSFSSKDREWAYSELLPKVEAHGFAVCTYDRNFKGGFLIQDIVQEAVSCSRRTLLVLTQHYVESEWCRWEFRVAQHRALQDNINRLIIVAVGEVCPEGIDEELQRYMQETNYLRWGEPHFWDKLLYSLPKQGARTRVIPNAYPMSPVASTIH
ncbi:toll-like receptor 2 type-2 isoform X1 [Dermacentor variabilis]|uniref:toll-like receptor 2 type-2 isoform X1 n=1 Tax=Dermacentor variabilis TaxID=34621 RepID=UPI003F5C42B8